MATATQARPALAGRLGAQNLTAGAIVLAGVLWLIWNLIDAPSQFFNVVVIGVTLGAIYALIALGYTLVYGIIELINFAHGDLFMIGSVFGMHLMAWLGARDSNPTSWLVIAVVTVAAMAACGSINVIIERVAYRPLRYAPKLAPLITAIGVSFILQNIGLLWNGPGQVGVRLVLPHGDLVEISGVGITWVSVIIVCVTGPLLYVLNWIVKHTKQGKGMRASAQDADAARLMGIDVNKTIAFTFAMGGLMAGAAGVMYAQFTTTTRFDQGFQLGLIAFTAAVLGGIGNLNGAVLGAGLIGLIQAFNDGLPHGLGQQWSQSVVFTILILILVFRPEGLLGQVTQEKV